MVEGGDAGSQAEDETGCEEAIDVHVSGEW